MRNLILRGGLPLALFSACVWWECCFIRAEEQAPSPAAGDPKAAGALVLKTGQLVEGSIRPSAGGYVVVLPKGSFLVPSDRVSVIADDRHGAYEKLKAAEPNPTPAFQLELARWCMAWKMFEEARTELREILIADPNDQVARRMYARLGKLMKAEPESAPEPEPRSSDGFREAPAESLAGLSPETTREFVVRVQPLLSNRCGNAGCHSPSSGQEFQIAHVRPGLHRQTLANLEAVLRLIKADAPEDSPLLKEPSGAHGRKDRPVFFGASGEQNKKTLKEWTLLVAKDLTQGPKEKSEPNIFAWKNPAEEEPDETLFRGAPEEPKQKPLTPEEQEAREKEELLRSILEAEQKDAFDPEEFNRKFGN